MPATDAPSLFPLFLKLEGRAVLVVGAGAVAERKIASLLGAGARVRVVAPEATDEVRRWAGEGRVEWRARAFEEGDAEGAWLVVAATSSADAQRRAGEAAAARRVFCLAVDDPPNASAYSGGIVRRPPFTVAISSSGATPALTRLVREVVEHVLPGDRWVERATELRAKWLAEGTPVADRFAQLVREVKKGTE
ncbi:MAG TPA: bifunctional precorrin-2 dehydrogenase/sirohydrochlorin ferrochelatase [Polyangiaceae bacterium]